MGTWGGGRKGTTPIRGRTTAAAHPTHPGGGKFYEPTDLAPMRRDFSRTPPRPHDFPSSGRLLEKNYTQTPHAILSRRGPPAKIGLRGVAAQNTPLTLALTWGEEPPIRLQLGEGLHW